MYKKGFYITKPVGNNAFSYEKRKNKKIYVPELIKIDSFDDIKLQKDKEKIAFEDFDFYDKLSTNYGLENFYEIEIPHPNPLLRGEGIKQKIYLFDNHNHALYFWYKAKNEGIIGNNNRLIHIDEHADTRDSDEILENTDLESIFNYTNFSKINVGNYIIPAKNEGLIGDIVQIRNETNLLDYLKFLPFLKGVPEGGGIKKNSTQIILNLDLDFFQPDLDFIDYELKKKVILDVAEKASIITVCTSPFFIDQELAIKVFKDIFLEK